MGISSDGILCYGFRIMDAEGNEESPDLPYTNDFDKFVSELLSLKAPGDYDEGQYNSDPDFKKTWIAHWADKKKAIADLGVNMVCHCSFDYSMYILAALESIKNASRGYPEALGQSIVAQEEWRAQIESFCTRANIPFKEPEFLLCSVYG